MILEKLVPGQNKTPGYRALEDITRDYKPGEIHSDTIRLRVSGALADLCEDTYYTAHEDGLCLSRLWNGWAKGRSETVGNFGNFLTLEQARGRGIGKKVLELWYEDVSSREDKPLALFCSAKERAARLYFPYGFQTAMKGAVEGPLFMPIADPSWDFDAFCEMYYQPAEYLVSRPASFSWRHEIDCLLHFALQRAGESFGLGDTVRLEQALLYYPERAGLFFTPAGRCVGWSVDGVQQLHPAYRHLKIETL
ncbi:MAG: hypothetical protein IJP02_04195 [Oscillospiraceae bacterium]|nr:hypothetical protein [Oscillospiraceae bacterium]